MIFLWMFLSHEDKTLHYYTIKNFLPEIEILEVKQCPDCCTQNQ